jgi:integron integrase
VDSEKPQDKKEKKLVERLHEAIRIRNYSRRTEQSYWYWIRYFIHFHGKRHPVEMGAPEVTAFLTWLATERDVAAATQNQALSALLFLYKHILGQDLPWLQGVVHAKRPVRIPTVLTEAEAARLLGCMNGSLKLMAGLLYGSGLRQIECLSLRVKDLDFAYRQITVRGGKGGKDRVTMLPDNLAPGLRQQLGKVRVLHRSDLAEGYGEVSLPNALSRKYPRDQARRPRSADHQARQQPHVAPLIRHAPARTRPGHPHGAGTARPQRRQHDDDLHACAQQGRPRRDEPARPPCFRLKIISLQS